MDIKEIVLAELKKEGLSIGEDVAERFVELALNIIEKVVIASENKLDDVALAIIPVIRPLIMKAIDNIDKSDNE